MLPSLKDAIDTAMSDSNTKVIDWVHTTAEIVEGVDVILAVVAAGGTGAISAGIAAVLDGTVAGLALPVAGAAAGVVSVFAALGLGYAEAADDVKKERAGIGFAEGVVMGAMKEQLDFVKSHFFKWSVEDGVTTWHEGDVLAQHYYNAALALGYHYGYELNHDETGLFWTDLARGVAKPLDNPDAIDGSDEREKAWVDFYITAAGQFFKLHIHDQDT